VARQVPPGSAEARGLAKEGDSGLDISFFGLGDQSLVFCRIRTVSDDQSLFFVDHARHPPDMNHVLSILKTVYLLGRVTLWLL
jgi:hypothetical protein